MAETKRVVSPGAEKWLGVVQNVLNGGEIELVDYMGTDAQNIGIARISHGKILPHSDDADTSRLTNYLIKNRHTSPQEFIETTWRWRLPIFVARQVIRHRTAGVNEQSARYSELEKDFYEPELERVQGQGKTNKQGSEGQLDESTRFEFVNLLKEMNRKSSEFYGWALEKGVAKELARVNLPVGVYTNWVWKMDLHNLFHFLHLRHPGPMGDHAQYEVRVYAEAIGKVIKEAWPIHWAAFEEHVLYAQTFSRSEMSLLKHLFSGKTSSLGPEHASVLKKQDELIKKVTSYNW